LVISGFMFKFAAQNKICNHIEILINFKRLKNNREMKKKYFAPEMEELELDEPIVLADQEGSVEDEKLCTDKKGCDGDF